MNNLLVLNPLLDGKKIIFWFPVEAMQNTYLMLCELGVRIDGFCTPYRRNYPIFMGKHVYSVMELLEQENYVLVMNAVFYDNFNTRYGDLGIPEENIFICNEIAKPIIRL